MAHATHLTISTCDRIRLGSSIGDGPDDAKNEVRQEVQVSVTYALDPGDTDVVRLADRKALEVTLAHEAAWNRIGAFRGNGGRSNGGGSPGCYPGLRAATEDLADHEDKEENDDPSDRSDDDPLAGLPYGGDDLFGGGPALAGAARRFPAAPKNGEKQSGNGATAQSGRSLPHARSQSRNGRPEAASGSDREPDPAPDAQPITPEPLTPEPLTGPQKILIRSRARKIGLTSYALDSLVFQQFKVWKVERLSKKQAVALLDALERDLKAVALKEKETDQKERSQKEREQETQDGNGKEGVPHADNIHASHRHAAPVGTA